MQPGQPQISRLLKKINAVKVTNCNGIHTYQLPFDVSPPPIASELSQLVTSIEYNESLVVVKTSSGSASLIARILDDKVDTIIGTIAGDDTIFIAPHSKNSANSCMKSIAKVLGFAINREKITS